MVAMFEHLFAYLQSSKLERALRPETAYNRSNGVGVESAFQQW
jgi:hypothetical protein